MTIIPNHDFELEALGLIEVLRDALRHANSELQRRCIILDEIHEALTSAEFYLAARYKVDVLRYKAPPIPKLN